MTTPVEIAKPSVKIPMTAPVEINTANDAVVMRFFMPSNYSKNDLPDPSDPRVKLVELEPMTAAVLVFSGSTGDKAVSMRTTELMAAIQNTKWRGSGAPTAFFYNPPWTLPFLRRNEVAVPVLKRNDPRRRGTALGSFLAGRRGWGATSRPALRILNRTDLAHFKLLHGAVTSCVYRNLIRID